MINLLKIKIVQETLITTKHIRVSKAISQLGFNESNMG